MFRHWKIRPFWNNSKAPFDIDRGKLWFSASAKDTGGGVISDLLSPILCLLSFLRCFRLTWVRQLDYYRVGFYFRKGLRVIDSTDFFRPVSD
jgi:hypothetical protein